MVINVLPYMTVHSSLPCSGVVVAVLVTEVEVVADVVTVVDVGVVVNDEVGVVEVVWLVVGVERTAHASKPSASYAVTIWFMVATVAVHSFGSFRYSNVLQATRPSSPSGPLKRRSAWFRTSAVALHRSPCIRRNVTPLLVSHATLPSTPSCGTRGSTPASSKHASISPLSARACPMQFAFASMAKKSLSAVSWQTRIPSTAVVVSVVVGVEVSVNVFVVVPVEVGEKVAVVVNVVVGLVISHVPNEPSMYESMASFSTAADAAQLLPESPLM